MHVQYVLIEDSVLVKDLVKQMVATSFVLLRLKQNLPIFVDKLPPIFNEKYCIFVHKDKVGYKTRVHHIMNPSIHNQSYLKAKHYMIVAV